MFDAYHFHMETTFDTTDSVKLSNKRFDPLGAVKHSKGDSMDYKTFFTILTKKDIRGVI